MVSIPPACTHIVYSSVHRSWSELQGGCHYHQSHFEVSIIWSVFIVCLWDSFVLQCEPLQRRSSPPFTAPFRALAHFCLSLAFLPALPIPSFSVCASSWGGGIDECLSAQATLKRSIAWWLWCLSCGCALRALPRWQSATENAADAIPEPCTTVDWSIGHRVKCSPRERGWGWRAQTEKKRRRWRGQGEVQNI